MNFNNLKQRESKKKEKSNLEGCGMPTALSETIAYKPFWRMDSQNKFSNLGSIEEEVDNNTTP